MQKVVLKPLRHTGYENIGIYYDNHVLLNNIVKKLPQVKWSKTNKCWYVPLSAESYNRVYKALKEKSELDITELKIYLEKRKQVIATVPPPRDNIIAIPAASSPAWQLSKENLSALERF